MRARGFKRTSRSKKKESYNASLLTHNTLTVSNYRVLREHWLSYSLQQSDLTRFIGYANVKIDYYSELQKVCGAGRV